ncbi:Dehydrin [Nymphaea thermarum]|nr:Dehydrin [Nymphaea thermarum]
MAEDHKSHGSDAVVSGRGLLDVFKKEKDDDHRATELEDVNVSQFKQDNVEKEEDDHYHGLKFHGSDDSSSSSGEEEGDSEEKIKKKKKEKKSLKDKIKVKICGEEEKPKAGGEELLLVKEGMPVVEVEGHPPEKKSFLEKIKEKMPGGDSNPAPPRPTTSPLLTDTVAHQPEPKGHCHEGEGPEIETKGIVEKIKEKLPGYHPKSASTEGGQGAHYD